MLQHNNSIPTYFTQDTSSSEDVEAQRSHFFMTPLALQDYVSAGYLSKVALEAYQQLIRIQGASQKPVTVRHAVLAQRMNVSRRYVRRAIAELKQPLPGFSGPLISVETPRGKISSITIEDRWAEFKAIGQHSWYASQHENWNPYDYTEKISSPPQECQMNDCCEENVNLNKGYEQYHQTYEQFPHSDDDFWRTGVRLGTPVPTPNPAPLPCREKKIPSTCPPPASAYRDGKSVSRVAPNGAPGSRSRAQEAPLAGRPEVLPMGKRFKLAGATVSSNSELYRLLVEVHRRGHLERCMEEINDALASYQVDNPKAYAKPIARRWANAPTVDSEAWEQYQAEQEKGNAKQMREELISGIKKITAHRVRQRTEAMIDTSPSSLLLYEKGALDPKFYDWDGKEWYKALTQFLQRNDDQEVKTLVWQQDSPSPAYISSGECPSSQRSISRSATSCSEDAKSSPTPETNSPGFKCPPSSSASATSHAPTSHAQTLTQHLPKEFLTHSTKEPTSTGETIRNSSISGPSEDIRNPTTHDPE